MMRRYTIRLGAKCTDLVTGYTGIVTARWRDVNGATRYCLTQHQCYQAFSFDEHRLRIRTVMNA